MGTAFAVSVVFLMTYVLHKILIHGVHTPFGGEGAIRTFYYVMLTSHIILAIVIVPLVLVTLRHAVAGRFDRHRAWARWTFPLWYYVSVTGVLVYFFLYQWFPHK
jgi:putative membrane protein